MQAPSRGILLYLSAEQTFKCDNPWKNIGRAQSFFHRMFQYFNAIFRNFFFSISFSIVFIGEKKLLNPVLVI